MFKKFLLTSFLLLSSFITIYPSKKENTNILDYCYSLEKIISRNTVEKSKYLSKTFKPLAQDITLFGTKKTKGNLANKMIDQYKNHKKLFIINFVPNQIYCLTGYWIEEVSPGKFGLQLMGNRLVVKGASGAARCVRVCLGLVRLWWVWKGQQTFRFA